MANLGDRAESPWTPGRGANSTQEIALHLRRGMLILGSLAMSALFLLVLFFGVTAQDFLPIRLAIIAGDICVIGLATVIVILRVFSRAPVLRVTHAGLLLDPNVDARIIGVSLIPWSEIAENGVRIPYYI